MKSLCMALAIASLLPLTARAEEAAPPAPPAETAAKSEVAESTPAERPVVRGAVAVGWHSRIGLFGLDLFLPILIGPAEPPPQPVAQRAFPTDDDEPVATFRRRRYQARQGLLLSFGLGGGSMYISNPGIGRTGAYDFDFRVGYGFSDRFQMFLDFDGQGANYANAGDIESWTATIRGQTVLIGDRAGNGLNVNAGIGLGGISQYVGYWSRASSPSGLALAGGLSYDARLSPWFSLSPELFLAWHAIPNVPGYPQDVAAVYGFRLNFLWYLH